MWVAKIGPVTGGASEAVTSRTLSWSGHRRKWEHQNVRARVRGAQARDRARPIEHRLVAARRLDPAETALTAAGPDASQVLALLRTYA